MEKELKIHVISDTHTMHEALKLPGGDMLIHAGDMSFKGTIKEVLPFLEWFGAQPYSHLILIPGNHDFGFEQYFGVLEDECKRRNIHLLNDSGIEIEGIKIWGSPITPFFNNWAFNRQRGEDIKAHWKLIPTDTEILVTHGPPYGILDQTNSLFRESENVGCSDLLHKIARTQVKLHVFGHIHEQSGHMYKDNVLYVNATCLDERFRILPDKPTKITKKADGEYYVDA
jgi:Icc-related predicted phosphoesterase